MARPSAEDWRQRHQTRGEGYRWFKACPVDDVRGTSNVERDGRLYVEQTLASGVKALVHRTVDDIEDPEYGLIPKGTAAISVMPDESYLGRLDRVVLTGRKKLARPLIARGSGASDLLHHDYPVAIVEVRVGATKYTATTDYSLNAGTHSIVWVNGRGPAAGVKYMVEYTYNPIFVFLGSDQLPRPDRDGVMMPQRGVILEKLPRTEGS